MHPLGNTTDQCRIDGVTHRFSFNARMDQEAFLNYIQLQPER